MNTIILNTVSAHPDWLGSYVRGMASAFNLRGRTYREYSLFSSAEEADVTAVQNDWETVAGDLRDAYRSVVK